MGQDAGKEEKRVCVGSSKGWSPAVAALGGVAELFHLSLLPLHCISSPCTASLHNTNPPHKASNIPVMHEALSQSNVLSRPHTHPLSLSLSFSLSLFLFLSLSLSLFLSLPIGLSISA
eukprot:TRINITY_DN1979_c1_g1_i1.p2 TRINITY_DN1979_c1_g1~~TRINITY_DN1979_c1_g1_i1.p2  ORF type:complete len:118 (+),score=26.26 TRINITY_DN1979_c1_g1_i1:337-690(+)